MLGSLLIALFLSGVFIFGVWFARYRDRQMRRFRLDAEWDQVWEKDAALLKAYDDYVTDEFEKFLRGD